MGKIKGWTKSKRANPDFQETRWESDNSAMFLSVVYDGATWRLYLGDVFGGSEEMQNNRDKKIVLKTAMIYMRSQPNG